MGAMGIVRSRDVISQTGIAGMGGAGHFDSGHFDSKALVQLSNWWRAGAGCFARHLHRSEHFRYVSQQTAKCNEE